MSPKAGQVGGHSPATLDKFNGLWDQGDPDNTPLDHFSNCENIQYIGSNSFGTRYGIDPFQNVAGPIGNIVRIYNYITQSKNTLLALTWDGATGKVYHVVDSTTIFLILTVTGMSDFGFVPYAGRAYITPFGTSVVGGLNIEKGLSGQSLYVYLGAGSPARLAAGATPAGTLIVANGAAGHTDGGNKNFAVVGETDSGFLSAPCAFVNFTTASLFSVSFSSVPTFTGTQWVKRHIVATISITSFNGDLQGYTYFFIPGAVINDNVTTTLANQSFYDADLLDDASHLLDNFGTIPAGVGMCMYHNRLCLYTTATDISLIYVSSPGEPEAINQISGLIVVSLDGNPITNAEQMRDVLYVMKRDRTYAYVDNGGDPSSWQEQVIDLALGCPVHGIATVIDSGATSTDSLIIATYRGIYIFNGKFTSQTFSGQISSAPELSTKIRGLWLRQTRNDFRKIQFINDAIDKILYCILPDGRLLIGDYNNGLDPKNIRWAPWKFNINVNTIALVNINTLIIGSQGALA